MKSGQLECGFSACSLRSTKLPRLCPDHIAAHAIVGFGDSVTAAIRIATDFTWQIWHRQRLFLSA
jgi:hypothetical protein